MILYIPHSSSIIPPEFRTMIMLDEQALGQGLLRMTDAYTAELYQHPEATHIVLPISRLIVDPERFEEDAQEPMSQVGMGVIYMHTSHGQPLKSTLTFEQRKELLSRFYDVHHDHSKMLDVLLSKLNVEWLRISMGQTVY